MGSGDAVRKGRPVHEHVLAFCFLRLHPLLGPSVGLYGAEAPPARLGLVWGRRMGRGKGLFLLGFAEGCRFMRCRECSRPKRPAPSGPDDAAVRLQRCRPVLETTFVRSFLKKAPLSGPELVSLPGAGTVPWHGGGPSW